VEFSVEFYVGAGGRLPVQEFLEELKRSDPGDHAAVLRGLLKLRNRQNHREPLSKALGNGLFELRHVGAQHPRPLVLCERPAHYSSSRHSKQRPSHPGSRPRDGTGPYA